MIFCPYVAVDININTKCGFCLCHKVFFFFGVFSSFKLQVCGVRAGADRVWNI